MIKSVFTLTFPFTGCTNITSAAIIGTKSKKVPIIWFYSVNLIPFDFFAFQLISAITLVARTLYTCDCEWPADGMRDVVSTAYSGMSLQPKSRNRAPTPLFFLLFFFHYLRKSFGFGETIRQEIVRGRKAVNLFIAIGTWSSTPGDAWVAGGDWDAILTFDFISMFDIGAATWSLGQWKRTTTTWDHTSNHMPSLSLITSHPSPPLTPECRWISWCSWLLTAALSDESNWFKLRLICIAWSLPLNQTSFALKRHPIVFVFVLSRQNLF